MNSQKLREALQAISHIDDTTNHSVDASAALDRIGQIARQALALPTAAPEMPLSINQFGRLVELTREHLTDNTFVYKATSKTGDTCHFGVESAAKAWAKGGTVEAIKVREFKLHTSAPTADHIPDAGEMVNGLTKSETDASASVYGLTADSIPVPDDMMSASMLHMFGEGVRFVKTAEPVGERELFERTMMDKFGWERKDFKTDGRDFYMDGNTVTAWMAWQARAALSAGDAIRARGEAV